MCDSRKLLQVAITFLHTMIPVVGICSGSTDSPANSMATFVLQGMKEARQELRSGICTVHFKSRLEDRQSPALSQSTNVRSITLTFAEGEGVRMEWVYSLSYAKSHFLGNPDDIPFSPHLATRTGYYIQTKDHSIRWFQGHGTINIVPPRSPCPDWMMYFDIKAIGFYSWVELRKGLSWNELIEVFMHKPIFQVTEAPDNVFLLTWQLGSANSEWILEVDANKGYIPIHATMRRRKGESQPWQLVQDFRANWDKLSGAWVPIKYEGTNLGGTNSNTTKFTMDFLWQHVNEPISPKLFSCESLDAPRRVTVVDSTLGLPVIVKHPGQALVKSNPLAPKRSQRVIILLVAMLAALVATFIIRRLRRRRAAHL